MTRSRIAVLALAVFAAGLAPASAARGPVVLRGDRVSVEIVPGPKLAVAVVDAAGRRIETLAADALPLAAAPTAPDPGAIADPAPPSGLSYVVGVAPRTQFRASPWSGNDLAGARAGVRFSATVLLRTVKTAPGWRVEMATNQPGVGAATLLIEFPARGQVRFRFQPPDAAGAAAVGVSIRSPSTERFFGFGERKDRVDQRGQILQAYLEETNASPSTTQPLADAAFGPRYTFPNGAQGSYYPLPSFLSSRGYGVLVESAEASRYDMAASHPDTYSVEVEAGELAWRMQTGAGLREVIRRLTAVTGRPPAVPEWAFRPWIDECAQLSEGDPSPLASTYSAGPAARQRVVDQLDRARAARIPVGVMGVDGWQEMSDIKGLVAKAAAQGVRLAAYINPFVGVRSPFFEQARALEVLARDAIGNPYVFVNSFNSAVGLVDFTAPNVEAFWRPVIERMLDLGFRAWMHDFGEEVQSDMVFADGRTGATMHNAYPVAYAAVTKRVVDGWVARHRGASVFFYMRSGWTGSVASTGGVFPGDETTDWGPASGLASEIPAMVNLAVSGVTAFTPDIAGYIDVAGNPPDRDLYTRWSQFAALSPGMRVHNSALGPERYPWSYDAEVLDIWRTYARLHARLAPYLARAAGQAATTGVGIGRPLYLMDPSAANEWLESEYLLGDDLLVAPILAPGASGRSVYLPRGARWIPLRVTRDGRLAPSGRAIEGGRVVAAHGVLSQIPIYLRAGARNPDGS